MPVLAYYRTPIGILRASFEDGILCSLVLCDDASACFCDSQPPEAAAVETALNRYFLGDPEAFDRIAFRPQGTLFQMKVWEALRAIPYGQVRTYGEIASAIGQPGAARAVGGACNKNHILLIIPCHRVVAAGGGIGGFAYGTDVKRQLLQLESPNSI